MLLGAVRDARRRVLIVHYSPAVVTVGCALCIVHLSLACPARRTSCVVTQPDGTRLSLVMCGDEWHHYYATADGTPMALDSASGRWQCHTFDSAVAARALALRAAAVQRCDERRARMVRAEAAENAYSGTRHALVILAEFADLGFVVEKPNELYTRMFNEEGYAEHDMIGSVRDYFLAQSYGRLDLSFDVVGPLTLPRSRRYYGANDRWDLDMHPGQFAADAIKAAERSGEVTDWTRYDWDGDGEVEQVYIVYAGRGEASCLEEKDAIWPHTWDLSSANMSGDGPGEMLVGGVTVNTYACSNELRDLSDRVPAGIGTFCHELSHCLGLPDIYDTSGGGGFYMEDWDLMDYGEYNGDGCVPPSYTAYERWSLGWLTPTVLDSPCEVRDLPNIDHAGDAYVVVNPDNANEVFMMHNVQLEGWNAAVAANGLMVTHIDYDSTAWSDNTVNNDALHPRVQLLCADDIYSYATQDGDLCPWRDNDSFSLTMNPGWSKTVTNVKHEDGLIAFSDDGGSAAADVAAMHNSSTSGHDRQGVMHNAQFTMHNSAPWYDLCGRRVSQPSRGTYIRDGRVVVRQ